MLKLFFGVCFFSFGWMIGFPTITMAHRSVALSDAARAIPLNADGWTFKQGAVKFLPVAPTIHGIAPPGAAMKISGDGGAVVANNIDFSEGVIDFDIQPTDSNFASFYFHRKDEMEAECFYFRTAWASGRPDVMEAIQYTPVIKGVACWNLLPYYQGNANFRMDSWNHVRIKITGHQMMIYVNTDTRPTLTVPLLEGNASHGSFAFEGEMTVAHLIVQTTQAAGIDRLNTMEGYDPTDNDPRYLRRWQVTQPETIPPGIDFGKNLLPAKQAPWTPIQAERRGLINLTRQFGGNLPGRNVSGAPRRIVWLKTTLRADRDWNYHLKMGFTNDVWVLLNGQYLYFDKNYYDEPSMKTPRGRASIDNSSFNLPLKAGANELLVGVGNDFFGWGIIARLDENGGVHTE